MTKEEINKMFEGRWRVYGSDTPLDSRYEHVKALCRDFFEAGILLAGESPSPRSGETASPSALPSGSPDGKTPIESRAETFFKQVHSQEFTSQYPEQLLADFFSYWSEPNRSKTKMRFELQKTWALDRRLANWARNDFNHYGTNKPTVQQQRVSKLTDILR